MGAVFITGTGTDVGKTFVAASLIRLAGRAGRKVDALKPVISGFDPDNAECSDTGELLQALGRPITGTEIERISPWRFKAPLSPDMAAKREGRSVDFDAVVDFSRCAIADAEGTLVIEGVGGIMVPLDETHTVLDWMAALRIPVLLVAGSYLGSISHTLTCLEVLRRRELAVDALVVSESEGSTVPLEETVKTITRFAQGTPVLPLPRLAGQGTEHPTFSWLLESL